MPAGCRPSKCGSRGASRPLTHSETPHPTSTPSHTPPRSLSLTSSPPFDLGGGADDWPHSPRDFATEPLSAVHAVTSTTAGWLFLVRRAVSVHTAGRRSDMCYGDCRYCWSLPFSLFPIWGFSKAEAECHQSVGCAVALLSPLHTASLVGGPSVSPHLL